MEEIPGSPYENPALVEASQGDRPLLDRLVAREHASRMLAENPDDPGANEHFRVMDDEVNRRREELGITDPPPLPPED